VQVSIKAAVRNTPETLVRQAQMHAEVDSPRSVRQVSRQYTCCDMVTEGIQLV
jgi:hypothetical protein